MACCIAQRSIDQSSKGQIYEKGFDKKTHFDWHGHLKINIAVVWL